MLEVGINTLIPKRANASPLHPAANTPIIGIFKKLKCYKLLRFLSFVFVSYFDIRISNLVAAKGRAVSFAVKLFLVAALLCYGIRGSLCAVLSNTRRTEDNTSSSS